MIFRFLRDMLSPQDAGRENAAPADPVRYKGFTIEATPRKGETGWSTEGIISREIEGELKTQRFIRADTSGNKEEAIRSSILKGQRIIDEQGDRLFRSG